VAFILPKMPSPEAEIHELADFLELIAWQRGTASARELVAFLGRLSDNLNNLGAEDDEDKITELSEDVMLEIDRRVDACGPNAYPFELDSHGGAIEHSSDWGMKTCIYRFLLLSTRLNMRDHKIHGELDGTFLMEELCSHVIKYYLGKHKARSLCFGTSQCSSFADRVNLLCKSIGEGTAYSPIDHVTPLPVKGKSKLPPIKKQDDKLDTVGWVPFADGLPGQLIAFGQCKTGSTWDDLTTQLQPLGFSKKWFKTPILVDPVRVFFVAEAADRRFWRSTTIETGIFLDRCRIVDFSEEVEDDLMERIVHWTKEAHKTVDVENLKSHHKAKSKNAPKKN
jgi:hypothetical protein